MPRTKTRRLRPVEKLSFCPDCGKRFSNETNVLRHMNQPSVACGSLIPAYDPPAAQVDRPHNVLTQAASSSRTSPRPRSPHQPGSSREIYPDDPYGQAPEDLEYPDIVDGSDMDCDGDVEYHPNVCQTFPGGSTFMDNFFADKYGSLRWKTLFYPFASQADWQLGSWLLRSGLSMAAIDGFLSLDLVGTHSFTYASQLIRVDFGADKDTRDFVPVRKAATLTSRDATIRTSLEMSPAASVCCNEARRELVLSGSRRMPSGIT